MNDTSAAGRPGDTGRFRVVRVVVGDDSAETRRSLRAQLELVDRVRIVGVAADGAAAVEHAIRESPDLVVLGIAMSKLDGLEATAKIRRRLPQTKIVVYSAFSRRKMAEPAKAAGADAYVEKAAPLDELVAAVRRLFPLTVLAVPTTRLPMPRTRHRTRQWMRTVPDSRSTRSKKACSLPTRAGESCGRT